LPATVAIANELIDFLREKSTLVLAVANDGGVPELGLGLACLIDDDGRRLRAVFDRRHAVPLLDLVQAGRQAVALVCSRPTDLRTVQVKGRGARVEPLPVAERAEVDRVVRVMRHTFGLIDFGDPYAATLLDHDPAELVCVGFEPVAVFEQTPGPQAGQSLAGPRP